ncbi:MAG: lamin tail domain-containing protein [Verrucomicrobiae bacterium]|nr:lamin tail domain-containing protein [Verrucomicrobiae bacterium]
MLECFRSTIRSGLLVLLLLAWGPWAGTANAQSAGILREVWLNIGGTAVADLTNNPAFPNNPSLENVVTDLFESPTDVYEDYGQRLRALITAPSTGNYRFWMASDDGGQLFLSTTDSPANRQLIAWVSGWTSSREWTREANQQSALIPLVAGQRYYIEAMMKEGGGGDNLAVRWQLPNGTMEEPIPASRCVPYGLGPPVITSQPGNVIVTEGGTATFTVGLARMLGATFQWKRNGANIPGATANSYALSPVALSDSGSTFFCAITNSAGWTNSTTATLTVQADNTPPTLVSVVNLGDSTRVTVLFSEPVEAATAANAANYALNQGATVSAARFAGDDRTIVLETSALAVGPTYTLTVNNVRDRASSPNTISPNSQQTFSLTFTSLNMNFVKGATEPPGPSSRRTGLAITEIMYHPTNRTDGRNLEFIELFNSEAEPYPLAGCRITGAVDYTFPPGTTLAARSYLVVASVPADIQAVYGIGNVIGPFTNNLPNSSGLVRLRNPRNAILLEVEYSDAPPWPLAADGAGHSLVLARPSYGEGDVRAWAASDRVGGSPGNADTATADPHRTIMINEFLAHTDAPQVDFIELYNYGSQAVDVSGCTLSDRPDTNKFVIPGSTVIPAGGFVSFTETHLGFALSTLGEDIYLKNPTGTRVIDALRFDAQANGIATGRYPDGAPNFHELAAPTPGTANAKHLARSVVINELMFSPMTDNDLDEYVELHNRSDSPVDLGGWRFTEGINFTFPPNTTIAANGYLVVARNVNRLLTNYPGLNPANAIGNFSGNLANGGERLALAKLDYTITTNNNVAVTNTIYVVVDEVTYKDGGRWGRWADRGGSSLELVDARSDNRLAANWADSDETAKSSWVTVEHTGVLDNGNGASDELHIMLLGGGECLIDNVEVFQAGGPNRVSNGTFEPGLDGWVLQGNHVASGLNTGEGFSSSRSLHLRASAGGDNGANRIKIKLTSGFSNGQTVTLRAKARWLAGQTNLLLRLKGNYLEAVGALPPPVNLGTPGAPNSRAVVNAGPAIHSVAHTPVLPTGGQAVQVVAQVHDPDGLASLQLVYRADPSTNLNIVSMVYNGAGFYSATIPGQSSGTLVAFHIRATDAHASAPATSRFPDDAPARECLVRFGESSPAGTFGVYRLWMTQANINTWAAREKLSNEAMDGTFVYGNSRVVYNAGGRYRGSPFIRPGYNSPIGNLCAYVWTMPKDDAVLGTDEFNLDTLEPGRDNTRQREKTSFWIAEQLGVPFSYQRYVHLYVNGFKRGDIYADSQQPNSDFIRSWFPNDDRGEIFKIDDWFEFNDSVSMEFNVDATLQNFTTTGGAKKQARYRWNWEKKSNRGLDDDYTRLFALVDAMNTPGTTAYTEAVEALVDVEQWLRVFAARRVVADWDGYGYNRGKNQFTYKPQAEGWKMLLWDLDFSLGGGSDSATSSLFSVNDPTVDRMYQHPPFRRAYLRAFYDAANRPLAAAISGPVMDATYAALQANAISAASPDEIKSWINARRNYINTQLANVAASFEFTVNGGNNFSTSQNLVTLTGTAPVQVKTIKINGVAYPVSWTALTQWTLQYALGPGVNALNLQAYDSAGNLIGGLSDSIAITYTGAAESPQDHLVINEVMFNPAAPDAEYIEIHNRSSLTAFDLSNYQLNGVGFNFPEGTIIPPNGYVLAVENYAAFLSAYGPGLPVGGVYSGALDNGGETLRLIRPGATPEADLLIDEVTYDDDPPWPVVADGFGPSLQLINPALDNNRVANWAAVADGGSSLSNSLIAITDVWKYEQSGNDLGIAWRQPGYNDAAWPAGAALLYVENSALPAPKNTPLTLGRTTYYFRKSFNFSGNPATTTLAAQLVIDDGAVVYLNGVEVLRLGLPAGTIAYNTFANRTVDNALYEGPFDLPSAALVEGVNVLAVEVHQINASSSDIVFGMTLDASSSTGIPYTPGVPNAVGTTLTTLPPLWLNEVQVQNVTGPQDRFGERDPWVELFHSGAGSISLNDFYLTDNYTNLTKWAFPAGTTLSAGEFKLIWLDGQPAQTGAGELHASFALSSPTGSVALVQVINNHTSIVDYLNYNLPVADRSYGAFPDGTPTRRTRFYIPTAAAPNTNGHPEVPVVINEWMAGNTSTTNDPLDGSFSDWFELYNYGSEPVDLSGFTITDNLSNPTKSLIPDGFVIEPGGFLLVWADNEPQQNGQGSHLHANFALSLGGEALGLYAPNGFPIHTLTFGPQTNDISEGFWPDAGANRYFMPVPTPGAPNQIPNPPNLPPVLNPIGNRIVNELALLSFLVTASDPDPGQSLMFGLEEGAPEGAAINPESGLFTWTPTETQGPGVYGLTIRVTDNGTPNLSDTETITVTVNEVNTAPVLQPIGNQTVDQETLLTFTALASDADVPLNALTFGLDEGAPTGAVIDPHTGVFTWTPTAQQAPGVYPVTIVATDNGVPPLNAAETITITVNTVSQPNQPPQLSPMADVALLAGRTLNLTNVATDPDVPPQTLTFQLLSAPAGMTLHAATGWLAWRPRIAQSGSTNTVVVRVADDGTPSLADTQSFVVTVLAPALPFLSSPALSNGSFSLVVHGDEGPDYILERAHAAAPANWVPLTTNLSPTLPFLWSEPASNHALPNLYRARLAP